MNGLKRCPQCFKLPEIKVEATNTGYEITLVCEQANHSHMATGPNEQIALENWNHYVSLVQAVA